MSITIGLRESTLEINKLERHILIDTYPEFRVDQTGDLIRKELNSFYKKVPYIGINVPCTRCITNSHLDTNTKEHCLPAGFYSRALARPTTTAFHRLMTLGLDYICLPGHDLLPKSR